MVTVKVFGIFRLDSGIREMRADVEHVADLYPLLLKQAKKNNPHTRVKAADVNGCIILVNGEQKSKHAKLRDGDEVMLISPVCGG